MKTGYTNYIDSTASAASLAKHMLFGIDRKSDFTTVPTLHLATVLEAFVGVGFGEGREDVVKIAASMGAALVSAEAAQTDRAIGRDE